MVPLGFHHVAIKVLDVEAVAAFYRDVLSLPELQRWARPDGALRSIWLGATAGQGAEGGFLAVEATELGERPSHSIVALRIAVGQRAALLQALAAQGVAVMRETDWSIFVFDPSGNTVGLSHHPVKFSELR
jgi:catechol 2,3-dioxygenase-like lactoylglutathione lyase family enzyme